VKPVFLGHNAVFSAWKLDAVYASTDDGEVFAVDEQILRPHQNSAG